MLERLSDCRAQRDSQSYASDADGDPSDQHDNVFQNERQANNDDADRRQSIKPRERWCQQRADSKNKHYQAE